MYCNKCGAKNDDSAAYCNKCGAAMAKAEEPEVVVVHANALSRDRIEIGTKPNGEPDVKVTKAPVSRKGIAVAVVAVLIVAVAGVAFFYAGHGDDGPNIHYTEGVFVLTDSGSTNYDQTVLYKGTVTVTIENGNMYYSMDLDKKDVTKDGVTISPTVIKRYTTNTESNNTPLWPNYSPMNDMKASFPFLNGYSTTSIMCTFSNDMTEVEAYKFVNSSLGRAIYVSTDGVIYQWCERVDGVATSFILNGWTRTSNYSGYFC